MSLVRTLATIAAAALVAAACDDHYHGISTGNGPAPDPVGDVAGEAHWVLEGFSSAGNPSGYPIAEITWTPPSNWDQEVFRVYSRETGSGSYYLIATVASCSVNGCVFRDRGVNSGKSYDYYVSSTDERADVETPSARISVRIPAATSPQAPIADSAVSLDGAAYLRWKDGGLGKALWKYVVLLTHEDATAYNATIGETDSPSFLDARTANGHVFGYRVAAIDTLEHVSALSAEMKASPRPDVLGDLVYTHQTDAAHSGFRFQDTETADPVVAGTAGNAQWRLERSGGAWQIVPLAGTSLLEFGRTTALSCGPGADSFCKAVTRAPSAGYQSTPISVAPEFSYVFKVTGSDGQPHYAVVRVAILGTDGSGHDLMIFDWAYQTLPNDVRLSVSRTSAS